MTANLDPRPSAVAASSVVLDQVPPGCRKEEARE